MENLIETYVRLLLERRTKQAHLSRHRVSDWGSEDHIDDLEARCADAAYWRDKYPKGSEKRSHYRNIYTHLRKELQSAKKANQLNEDHNSSADLLREYVSMILEDVPPIVQIPSTNLVKTPSITAGLKTAIQGNNLFTGVIRHFGSKSSIKPDHYRITAHLDELNKKSSKQIEDLVKQIVEYATGKEVIKVESKEDLKYSEEYVLHKATTEDGNEYNIIFSGTLESGQRGGGYEYEKAVFDKIKNQISTVVRGDSTKSDVYIPYGNQKVIVEVKGVDARFGQPTVYYDFGKVDSKDPKNSKPPTFYGRDKASPANKFIIEKLNDLLSKKKKLKVWLNSIKAAWDKTFSENEIDKIQTQITPEDWDSMERRVYMKSINDRENLVLKKTGPKLGVDISTITDYYANKGTNYIQIQNKGFYQMNSSPVDQIDFDNKKLMIPAFQQEAKLAFIQPEFLLSGGKYVIRATLAIDYSKLKSSPVDLDNDDHLKAFINALNVQSKSEPSK